MFNIFLVLRSPPSPPQTHTRTPVYFAVRYLATFEISSFSFSPQVSLRIQVVVQIVTKFRLCFTLDRCVLFGALTLGQ